MARAAVQNAHSVGRQRVSYPLERGHFRFHTQSDCVGGVVYELSRDHRSGVCLGSYRQVSIITQPTWDWENELGKGGLLTLPWHPRGRCGHARRALAEVPIENAC